jgi:hypothetical protein
MDASISPAALRQALNSEQPPIVIDVRRTPFLGRPRTTARCATPQRRRLGTVVGPRMAVALRARRAGELGVQLAGLGCARNT